MVGDVDGEGEVPVDVLDGAAQHPETVEQVLEPAARDDDLVLVEAAFGGVLAGLVVALPAALAAELTRPAGSDARRQRTLAPPAPPHLFPMG